MALHHYNYYRVCTEDYGRIQISLILGIMHACALQCVRGSLSSLPARARERGYYIPCTYNDPYKSIVTPAIKISIDHYLSGQQLL